MTAEHAQAAYDESFDSVHMFMLLNASPLAKVVLAAILQERRATGARTQRPAEFDASLIHEMYNPAPNVTSC